MSKLTELDALILEVKRWHKIRVRISRDPRRKGPIDTDTLPRVIQALTDYREVVVDDTAKVVKSCPI